jgi:hypothetical protein
MIRAARATALGSVSKLAAQAILLALPSGNYTMCTENLSSGVVVMKSAQDGT